MNGRKALLGYIILCVGVALALYVGALNQRQIERNFRHGDQQTRHALHVAETIGEKARGIICKNSERQDRQSIASVHNKALLKAFHLSKHQAEVLVHKQLVLSAKQRAELRPSAPPGACDPRITPIHPKGKR